MRNQIVVPLTHERRGALRVDDVDFSCTPGTELYLGSAGTYADEAARMFKVSIHIQASTYADGYSSMHASAAIYAQCV